MTFISNNVGLLLGFESADLINEPTCWLGRLHPDDRQMLLTTSSLFNEGRQVIEYRFRHADGTYRWLRDEARLIRDDGRVPIEIVGSCVDISEEKEMESALRDSLEEKEVMLSEIHHRVKNNLQVIIALMGLQAESVTDKKTQEMLAELQSRARTMSLVHETLYQSHNVARVNLTSYIQTLTAHVMQTISINFHTSLRVRADEIFVGIDAAIPCGLIINELVTNALKHAFSAQLLSGEKKPGSCEICIDVRADGPVMSLSVSDNGTGLPEGFNWKQPTSLGLRLVNILACNQLRGTIDVKTDRGTTFTITFSEPRTKKSAAPVQKTARHEECADTCCQ
jgi:PAS domain S-box-containing protein